MRLHAQNIKKIVKRLIPLIIIFCLMSLIRILDANFNQGILTSIEGVTRSQTSQLMETNLDRASVRQLLSSTEMVANPDQVQVALLQEGTLVWDSFPKQSKLQAYRQELRKIQPGQLTSQSNWEGYLVLSPFTLGEESYNWLKFYPRELFQDKINEHYGQLLLIVLIVLLLIYCIYYLYNLSIIQPLQSIRSGLIHLFHQDYSYDYRYESLQEINKLGEALMGLSKDMRDKRLALEASEYRLSILLDYINLGVILINQDGKIELVNPEAIYLMDLNYIPNNRNYQSVFKSLVLIEMIEQALEERQALNNEIELYIPNSKFIDVNIIPYSDVLEDPDSVLVLLYDITEVRRLETVRTEFVANASHELRTPVTAIKGFAETLLNGAIDNPEITRKFVTIISNESNRLEVLINDILELSKVEKEGSYTSAESINLYNEIRKMQEYFEAKAQEKDISITISGNHQIHVFADKHRVDQILINLIENAIKYSDLGGKVHLDVTRDKKTARISVSDTGIGIPEEDQERIFERFYRVDKGRSRSSGGTGLGLSIVRNLVRNLQGAIYVESQLGVGSTFYVELPIHDD